MELPRFGGVFNAWDSKGNLIAPFIIDRGLVIQARVEAMGIIPAFNILKKSAPGLVVGMETTPVKPFAFQGGKEALTQGVVKTVAHRTKRGTNPRLLTPPSKSDGGILRAMIRKSCTGHSANFAWNNKIKIMYLADAYLSMSNGNPTGYSVHF